MAVKYLLVTMWRLLLIVYSILKLVCGGGNSIPGWGGPSYILISSESEHLVNKNFFDNDQEEVSKRPKLGNNAREIYPEYLMSSLSQLPESTVSLQSKELSWNKISDSKHQRSKSRKSQEFSSESSIESKAYSEPSKTDNKKKPSNESLNSESHRKPLKNKDNEEEKLKKDDDNSSELSSKNTTQYNTTKEQITENKNMNHKNNTKEENISTRRPHKKLSYSSIDTEPSATIHKPENKTALNIRSLDEENKETNENESDVVSPSRKILRRLVQKSKSRDDDDE